MSGAGYILAINAFVAGLLATAFLTIAIYDQWRAAARWLAFSYLVGMATFVLELVIASVPRSTGLAILSHLVAALAFAAFNVGLARKYAVRVPWVPMGLILLAAPVACYMIQDMPRQSVQRMVIYQSPYFLLQAIAAWIVARARMRFGVLDRALVLLLVVSALQFMAKPFLLQPLGGTGASPDQYARTAYAMLSQSMSTVSAIAIALLLLVILLRDTLAEANLRSETDMLSGLLNRRGFEMKAAAAIREAGRRKLPVSLVISDIDHFKSINDSFGHAAGDRVIVSFARFLQSVTARDHPAGRIGGEEFAILLPGASIVAAKLFAEKARSTFRALEIDGQPMGRPAGKHVTASFGVAELSEGESITELLARADTALYLAKNSGRDCVKIAPRPRGDLLHQGTAVSLA